MATYVPQFYADIAPMFRRYRWALDNRAKTILLDMVEAEIEALEAKISVSRDCLRPALRQHVERAERLRDNILATMTIGD